MIYFFYKTRLFSDYFQIPYNWLLYRAIEFASMKNMPLCLPPPPGLVEIDKLYFFQTNCKYNNYDHTLGSPSFGQNVRTTPNKFFM